MANNGQFRINSTKAYCFGNGLAAGLGVGLASDFLGNDFNNEYVKEPSYLIPLFVNVNYSFLDGTKVSTKIGARDCFVLNFYGAKLFRFLMPKFYGILINWSKITII